MLWVLPLALLAVGLVLLTYMALRLQREIGPTNRSLDQFGRSLRPALVRVRDESRRTRRRLD
jgi:hypothetical protein